jgi:hypothetical protein
MDCAQNGLTGGGKFAKETNNVESALRVETGGRLVQEKQELRLGRELDTDGDTFALFDSKSTFGITNDSICDIFHFQQGDDLLDVGILLSLRSLVRLSQVGREAECLADRCSRLVNVKLFSVGSSSLEGNTGNLSVNKLVTADDTNILAVG